MAIATATEFLTVLEKSKLLDPEQLGDARRLAARSSDPRTIAKSLAREGLITRWQAGQLLAGRSSFYLGKYRLIELLSRGGMGNVFLGQHVTMNRRVALKILSRRVGKDPASLKRFLSEARAVAGLDHENIVRAYNVDNEGDRYYLVMEYVDGRNLGQIVEEDGPPDCETAADYIRQAADGLAHGHQRNMIHCNVKPSNLLVNPQGVVKIVDMGLARLAGPEESDDHGAVSGVLGSVDYLAPERALGTADFDHRADVYSLGCTLYFLLTGQPPFPEGTLPQRIMKHQTAQPRSILEKRPDAPQELVRICERMIAKQPADRPQSAEEVSRLLVAWRPPIVRGKPAVAPKRTQAWDSPIEEDATPPDDDLPQIRIETEPRATKDAGKEPADVPDAVGAPSRRGWKILAATTASLAAGGLLAVAILAMIGPDPEKDKDRQSKARADRSAEKPQDSAAATRPPSEKPADADNGQPGDGPAAEPAPDGDSPEDQPPPDQPPPDEPMGPDVTDPDEPTPDQSDQDPGQTEPDQPSPDETQPGEPPEADAPTESEAKQPFSDLATAVDLPPLAPAGSDPQAAEPVALGPLHVGSNGPVQIELLGGREALRGSRQFVLQAEQPGTGWLIRLDSGTTSADTSQSIPTARLRLDQGELTFQWLARAGDAAADYLRNCGLLIRISQQRRWLPLCQPVAVEPLVVNLEEGGARIPLPLATWMPKLAALQLQITGLEGSFPEHEFTPAELTAKEGRLAVVFSGKEAPRVELQLAMLSRRRAASVELVVRYQSIGGRWFPLRRADLAKQSHVFTLERHRLQALFDKLPNNDPRREFIKQQREVLKTGIEQLDALGDFYQEVHGAGKIRFRVFHPVDDHEVDLFVTPVEEESSE